MNEPLALPAPEQPKLLPPPSTSSRQPPGDGGSHGPRRIAVIALAVLVVLALIGWFFHHRQSVKAEEANENARHRIATVQVVAAESSSSTAALRLPATVSAWNEASLYARALGYLKTRHADIGDRVTRGQVLAEIDAPDLDQEVLAARQQLDQAATTISDANARVDVAKVTYERLVGLVKDLAVAQQQVDDARQALDSAKASLAASKANVGAAQAGLQRLVVLQGYEKVRAPFDGIVTARNVDLGALVTTGGATSAMSTTSGLPSSNAAASSSATGAGGSSGSSASQSSIGSQANELFRVAQVDRVRVFVTVPQENAAVLETDRPASVFVQGFEQPFRGTLSRTSRSFDRSARTMLVEVQVENPTGQLIPGMYAQVRFENPRTGTTPLLVPGEAIIARADGLSVAVIEALRADDRKRLPTREQLRKADEAEEARRDDAAGGSAGKQSGDAKTGADTGAKISAKGQGGAADGKSSGDDLAGAEKEIDDDPDHARRIHLQAVEVGRDYGTEIEVTRGLQSGQMIVANPGDDVVEGALVMPRTSSGSSRSSTHDAKTAPPGGIGSPSREAPTKVRK